MQKNHFLLLKKLKIPKVPSSGIEMYIFKDCHALVTLKLVLLDISPVKETAKSLCPDLGLGADRSLFSPLKIGDRSFKLPILRALIADRLLNFGNLVLI